MPSYYDLPVPERSLTLTPSFGGVNNQGEEAKRHRSNEQSDEQRRAEVVQKDLADQVRVC